MISQYSKLTPVNDANFCPSYSSTSDAKFAICYKGFGPHQGFNLLREIQACFFPAQQIRSLPFFSKANSSLHGLDFTGASHYLCPWLAHDLASKSLASSRTCFFLSLLSPPNFPSLLLPSPQHVGIDIQFFKRCLFLFYEGERESCSPNCQSQEPEASTTKVARSQVLGPSSVAFFPCAISGRIGSGAAEMQKWPPYGMPALETTVWAAIPQHCYPNFFYSKNPPKFSWPLLSIP